MHLLKKGEEIFGHVIDFLGFLSGLLLLFLMLITCYEVVMRYLFRSPSGWVVEVCEYMLLYITFFGTTWLLKHDRHVRVDILVALFKPKLRRILGLVTCLMGATSCSFLVVYGTLNTFEHFQNGTLVIQTLNTPKWTLVAVIPLGSFLLVIQFLRQFVALLRGAME